MGEGGVGYSERQGKSGKFHRKGDFHKQGNFHKKDLETNAVGCISAIKG